MHACVHTYIHNYTEVDMDRDVYTCMYTYYPPKPTILLLCHARGHGFTRIPPHLLDQ